MIRMQAAFDSIAFYKAVVYVDFRKRSSNAAKKCHIGIFIGIFWIICWSLSAEIRKQAFSSGAQWLTALMNSNFHWELLHNVCSSNVVILAWIKNVCNDAVELSPPVKSGDSLSTKLLDSIFWILPSIICSKPCNLWYFYFKVLTTSFQVVLVVFVLLRLFLIAVSIHVLARVRYHS